MSTHKRLGGSKGVIVAVLLMASWLASSLPSTQAWSGDAQSNPPAAPNQILTRSTLDLSPDVDGDGLPNDVEQNGWYNSAAGAPFTTDPYDSDSDDDGLTDGEEQLFDTDPNDPFSPGIYALYNDALKTRQYWSWQQHGDKYIAYSPSNWESVIARRGTSFEIGGPISATVYIQSPSGWAAKDLTKVTSSERDPATGRWTISIAPDAQVGAYDIKLWRSGFSWTPALRLYVIFALPDDMTPAEINTFLYDDDPDDLRDEIALWHDTREVDDGAPGYWAYSSAYRFITMQYEFWLFRNYVIPRIDGEVNRWEAAIALRQGADDDTVIDWPLPRFDSYAVVHNQPNQCSNISGLLTAYLRSAGLPARPIMTDWHNSTFDHATEFWLHGPGDTGPGTWYVNRGYWPHGNGAPLPRENWGYSPWYSPAGGWSDMVVVGGADWPWKETSGEGDGFTSDYKYQAMEPPPHEIVRQDWWETVTTAYWDHTWLTGWGWGNPPTEPVDIGDLSQALAPGLLGAEGDPGFAWPQGPPPSGDVVPIRLNDIIADYGLDQDGDGLYDQLAIKARVQVRRADTYWFYAWLGSDQGGEGMVGTGGAVARAVVPATLGAGSHTIQIPFSGRDIFARRVNGPYALLNLWVADFETQDREEIMTQALDSLAAHQSPYLTNAYPYEAFETPKAEFSGGYNEQSTVKANRDQILTLDVGLNIYEKGQYTVSGELYDAQGRLVGRAEWTGASGSAALRFDDLTGAGAPYSLRYLQLWDGRGNLLEAKGVAYTAGMRSVARVARPEGVEGLQITYGPGITPTQVYSDTAVDTDGDGDFDRLDIAVQVEVNQAGSYRLEGWLVNSYGDPIAYSLGVSSTLSTGVQTLTLPFDGQLLYGQGSMTYTLTALKVLEGAAYVVRDEVKVAYTTRAYDRSQFDSATEANLLMDDVENGDSLWTADAPWGIITDTYRSSTHAWTDSPGGDYGDSVNASLTISSPVNLAGKVDVALRFQTAYDLAAGDLAFVEVTTDTLTWTAVQTYTGASAHWQTEIIDLDAFEGSSSVYVRFRLQTNASGAADGWYLDDIYLVGWNDPTAVTLASFTAAPTSDGILLAWETATEIGNLGFHLYRAEQPDGVPVRLNETLIPSQSPGGVGGAVYAYLDGTAVLGQTYAYWLDSIDVYGHATRYGPLSIPLTRRFTYFLPVVLLGPP